MKQIVLASTLFGIMTATAAIDEGKLGDGYSERILITSKHSVAPEASAPLLESAAAAALLTRFDRVLSLNEMLEPQHPARWKVPQINVASYERLLRRYWDLGEEEVDLVLESVHVSPAATMAEIFWNSKIFVLSEGLMSYGPTREPQSPAFGHRMQALVYLDLVEGLTPLLLAEHGVPTVAVSPAGFRTVVEDMGRSYGPVPIEPGAEPTALVLGQYLAALGLMSAEEEVAMQVAMLERAQEAGAHRVIFKPHPTAPPADIDAIRMSAEQRGVDLVILRDPVPAEVLLAKLDIMLVVASFSTALVTAQRVFEIPIASVGADTVLEALKPYQNSNRIPATVVRALTRDDNHTRTGASLQGLITAVAYCMQPKTLTQGRSTAVSVLSKIDLTERREYFKRRRLGKLGLPGGTRPSRTHEVAVAVATRLPAAWRENAYFGSQSALRRVPRFGR
ncbi:MAG: polysialyltransferase family glycosyltransferase [Propioniciclava sp.]